jgi:hypothetical protein
MRLPVVDFPLTLPDLRDTSDVFGKRILADKTAAQEVLYLLISEPLMNLDAKDWIFPARRMWGKVK